MSKKLKLPQQPTEFRVRFPRQGEVLGLLEQRLGASRTRVRCFDGVTRICRIPGRLKRYLWVREGDIVLIEPWKDSTAKGDIIFKYNPHHVAILKEKGYIKDIDSAEEFQEF
ncbi:translation initiation factor eIF-1A [Candidatus Woesearchaeota archaeon]|nr:translation initiation factor eIF-1A [Candidatus Woesearchaeota archaeon]